MITLSEAKLKWIKHADENGWINTHFAEDIVGETTLDVVDNHKQLIEQMYIAYNFFDKEISEDEKSFRFIE